MSTREIRIKYKSNIFDSETLDFKGDLETTEPLQARFKVVFCHRRGLAGCYTGGGLYYRSACISSCKESIGKQGEC